MKQKSTGQKGQSNTLTIKKNSHFQGHNADVKFE